ncbi:hypothetical protein J0695_40680, partial [Streptomyces beijiangensis]|nr:hypothetical protein [Streptomyces beijiangensis]
ALLLALVVIGAVGVLLYDISAVRAGRDAMHWRQVAAGDLATRQLQDTWVLVGAGVAAASRSRPPRTSAVVRRIGSTARSPGVAARTISHRPSAAA